LATTDAQSYRNLLTVLGGKEFRIGKLQPAEGSTMQGQVVIYDGDPSGDWSSWAIVFAKVPGYTGSATATLLSSDGESLALPPIEFREGDGDTLLVTYADLTRFDRVTVTSRPGRCWRPRPSTTPERVLAFAGEEPATKSPKVHLLAVILDVHSPVVPARCGMVPLRHKEGSVCGSAQSHRGSGSSSSRAACSLP
jgi:hypothetical protein